MAKPLLPELKFFVNCVSTNYRKLPTDVSGQLVKCSLHLLEHLPASREAVLEYFATVFDVSVGNYIKFIEVRRADRTGEDCISKTFFFSFFFISTARSKRHCSRR